MAFESPTESDEQRNSNANEGGEPAGSAPEPTVMMDGDDVPVSDAVEMLATRIDEMAADLDAADEPVTTSVAWSSGPVPVEEAVREHSMRLETMADLMGSIEDLRKQIRELQKTVTDAGAVIAAESDRLDENPISWDYPAGEEVN
jgi:hypothetical protein